MKTYDLDLRFQRPPGDPEAQEQAVLTIPEVDLLDLLGLATPGRLGVMLTWPAPTLAEAIIQAARAVKRTLPGARLVGVTQAQVAVS